MKRLEVKTTATTTVTLDGLDVNDVLAAAADLAHHVLEELGPFREEHGIDEVFPCEAEACEFLDMIDD